MLVAFRWLKGKLLWRLRNRLIVTYVFIGVVPTLLLIAMVFATLYLFAGQFANFIVTSEIHLAPATRGGGETPAWRKIWPHDLPTWPAAGSGVTRQPAQKRSESGSIARLCACRELVLCDLQRWQGRHSFLLFLDFFTVGSARSCAITWPLFANRYRVAGALETLTVVSSEALDQDLLQENCRQSWRNTFINGLDLPEPSNNNPAGKSRRQSKSATSDTASQQGQEARHRRAGKRSAIVNAGALLPPASMFDHQTPSAPPCR